MSKIFTEKLSVEYRTERAQTSMVFGNELINDEQTDFFGFIYFHFSRRILFYVSSPQQLSFWKIVIDVISNLLN